MKAYVSCAYYDLDRGISSYSVFIPTPFGMKVESFDIHESWAEEEDMEPDDIVIIKKMLERKYKMRISLCYCDSHYNVHYRK